MAGYLQEQGGFEVLNLPAIAQRNETYELGDGRTYTRQKGELLHPEHEPAHVLAELKREMGPIAFSAQYQQSPIPPGGTIIKRKWLTSYDNVGREPGDRIIISWDIALSEAETGDYSACVVLLRRNEVFYILEVVRGRFPFNALKRKVMEVKQRYGSSTLLIEDSPISRGLIQSLREQSINVTVYKPETDKRARVIAQSDLFAGARFVFPGVPVGSRNSPRNCSLFPGAMTIRSTLSPRALHGAATDGARFLVDSSQGFSKAWPVASDGIFGRDRDSLRCLGLALYGPHATGNALSHEERSMLAELADKAASAFMQINDDQLRRRITTLERELATTAADLASVRPRSSMPS